MLVVALLEPELRLMEKLLSCILFYLKERDIKSPHVWMLCFPFVYVADHPLPAFECQVVLEHTPGGFVCCKNYEVDLVKPDLENEDEDNDEELVTYLDAGDDEDLEYDEDSEDEEDLEVECYFYNAGNCDPFRIQYPLDVEVHIIMCFFCDFSLEMFCMLEVLTKRHSQAYE